MIAVSLVAAFAFALVALSFLVAVGALCAWAVLGVAPWKV